MCKHAVKKLYFLIRYVLDRYKNQQICAKGILKNGETSESVPDQYKAREMCDIAVDNYVHALPFVTGCYKTLIVICNEICQFLSFCNMICS